MKRLPKLLLATTITLMLSACNTKTNNEETNNTAVSAPVTETIDESTESTTTLPTATTDNTDSVTDDTTQTNTTEETTEVTQTTQTNTTETASSEETTTQTNTTETATQESVEDGDVGSTSESGTVTTTTEETANSEETTTQTNTTETATQESVNSDESNTTTTTNDTTPPANEEESAQSVEEGNSTSTESNSTDDNTTGTVESNTSTETNDTDDNTTNTTDVTPPVITLNGEANITLEQGEPYTELGATASDTVDGNISVSINGTVDTTTIGEYILTYTATDSSGNSASLTRHVNVKSNEPTLESLVLSMKQTSFIRKKVSNSDYYTRVREPVTVMGIYSDGHSEDVTDNVNWSGERYGKVIKVQSGYLIGGILEKTKGLVTLTASIGDIKSNTLNIDVKNEQEERLLLVDISNKNKQYYKNRDASIYLDLVYKPTSDVKLRFKLKESDGVRFENGSLDTEIIFSPSDTRFDSHSLRLVDRDINNTNPYTITTEVFESDDARYGGKKPKDIVVEPSKIKLLVPSIEGRRGAIRGVPITFSVLSEHLSLKYTLVDPPKGMKIIEDYNPHNNAGGMPRIGGVNVEWNVPMDIEEKIYTITMKATDLEGNTAEVSFDIKVPQTKVIASMVVNNELIVTDKSSLLYGMKMKGHNGEDISSLKLRSVAYADVWKKKIKDKKPEDVVERTVFILDNMPDKLDVKMPEYMDTFKERIDIGMHSYKYNERMYDYPISFDPWDRTYGEIYLYENTNGYTFLHRDTEYERHGSKVFLIVFDKSQKIGK